MNLKFVLVITYCTKITTGNIIIWTKKKVDSYGCDCLDGVVLFCDPVLGAVAGPLATGVGVCAGTRRGKCLMFTLIPSSMTSRTPVWQGVPFLSKIIFTFKLWLFTITTKSRKQRRYLGWYNWYSGKWKFCPCPLAVCAINQHSNICYKYQSCLLSPFTSLFSLVILLTVCCTIFAMLVLRT